MIFKSGIEERHGAEGAFKENVLMSLTRLRVGGSVGEDKTSLFWTLSRAS